MKKIIFSLSFILCAAITFAQAPEKFQYQTVVRDNLGAPVVNQGVSFRLNIHEASAAGTTVYSETHSATTNDFGLVNLEIGGGTVVSGTFSTIDWGSNNYYVEVEMDPAGGTSYTSMGSTQLLSVPYALSSKTASDMELNDLSDVQGSPTNGQVLKWNGTTWQPQNDLGGTAYTAGTGISISGSNAISADLGTDISTSEIQNGAVTGAKIDQMSAANGEVLSWNGTSWAPSAATGGASPWTLTGTNVTRDTGNVGINNTAFTPLYTLTVTGDTNAAIAIGAQGSFNQPHSGRLVFSEDVLNASGTCGFEWRLNGATNRLVMMSGCTALNDTSMIINRTGEVLFNERVRIGSSINPSTDLHIKQSGNGITPGTEGIRFEESGGTTQWQQWAGGSDLNFAFNGTRLGYINDANGAYVTTSDRRVKTNISPMGNVLSGVMQLRPVTYYYKHHTEGSVSNGFIAQEVMEIFPQLVYHSEGEDDQLALAYSDFGILAIKAVQEQQAQIEKLQSEKEALADKNAELEARLKKLEEAVNALIKE